jgi:hypothetical protein
LGAATLVSWVPSCQQSCPQSPPPPMPVELTTRAMQRSRSARGRGRWPTWRSPPLCMCVLSASCLRLVLRIGRQWASVRGAGYYVYVARSQRSDLLAKCFNPHHLLLSFVSSLCAHRCTRPHPNRSMPFAFRTTSASRASCCWPSRSVGCDLVLCTCWPSMVCWVCRRLGLVCFPFCMNYLGLSRSCVCVCLACCLHTGLHS